LSAVAPEAALAPIDVVVVDDQRAILAGVSALIASEAPRLHVAGQARCTREALELAHRVRPRIVVLDVELGGEDGLALIPLLHACCDAAVVVFTSCADAHVRNRALRLGAAAFVAKNAAGEELLAAIHAAGG
jgi:DNA-binding NarL/FixJ family response regulator